VYRNKLTVQSIDTIKLQIGRCGCL